MPLVKPENDRLVGKCGMPAIETGRSGGCNKPGALRVAVDVDDGDNDYDYKYSSHFRAVTVGPVMVDMCGQHFGRMSEDFQKAERRVAEREGQEAKAAAKIREAKAAYEAAIKDYPGTWRDE